MQNASPITNYISTIGNEGLPRGGGAEGRVERTDYLTLQHADNPRVCCPSLTVSPSPSEKFTLYGLGTARQILWKVKLIASGNRVNTELTGSTLCVRRIFLVNYRNNRIEM